ncbi:MAG: SPASM domain-containing protein [Nitrososphaera sp.]|nr:SPASM domain-containing protein [Nitrososphaera sp.]
MSVVTLRPNQKNKYLALWEFAQGVADIRSVPPALQIARSNTCNFKCVYCIDHRVGNQIPRTKNEGETWQGLLALIPRCETLAFHGISEFMIDPEFFDTVRRCAEAGASLSLNTNASVCTAKYLEVLADYPGYLCINFSIDAATPESFLRIRGKDFWKIVRNIKSYVDRLEARRDQTSISLSFVITRSTVKDMVPLIFLAKALKIENVKYYRLHEYEGLNWQVETKAGGVFDYRDECTNQFGTEYNCELGRTRQAAEIFGIHIELPCTSDGRRTSAGSRMTSQKNPNEVIWIEGQPHRPLCDVPWLGTSVVLSDGNVNFCCFSSAVVGNVNTESFEQVWNGSVMRGIRQALSEQQLPPQCQSPSCPIFRGDDLHYIFERMEGPHRVDVTKTHDPHLHIREHLHGSKLILNQQDSAMAEIPELTLELIYQGEAPIVADLFVGIRLSDGVIRFLPDKLEYASPFARRVELSLEKNLLHFSIFEQFQMPSIEGDFQVCAALFEHCSNPNLLSNCYWADNKVLISSKDRTSATRPCVAV